MKYVILYVLFLLPLEAKAKTYEVEPRSQVIALLLNEHLHTTPQNKQLCLREVLFFSMKKGLVFCTHRPGDDVYKLKHPASTIPENMYFSREELNR